MYIENAEAESKEDKPYADSSSSDDDDEKETIPKSEFPDTEIKIDYSTSGKMVEFKAQCGAALEEPREQIHFVEKKDSNKNADKQNQKPGTVNLLKYFISLDREYNNCIPWS